MSPMHRFRLCLLSIALVWAISACNTGATARATPAQAPLSTQAPIASPDPQQATPSLALAEELLSGEIDLTATTITLPITVTKSQLAAELYTTPEMLDVFTQGLPDPVPQGYIVVVPRRYVAMEGEMLASIAHDLGVPATFLSAVNPNLPPGAPLPADTPVTLPRVYTVRAASTLAEIAAELKITVEALIAGNPGIPADQTLQPDQQLLILVPP